MPSAPEARSTDSGCIPQGKLGSRTTGLTIRSNTSAVNSGAQDPATRPATASTRRAGPANIGPDSHRADTRRWTPSHSPPLVHDQSVWYYKTESS